MGLEPNASVEIEIGEDGTGSAVVGADSESLQSVISNHPNAVIGISQHPSGAIINVAGGIAGETTTVTYYTEAADAPEPESGTDADAEPPEVEKLGEHKWTHEDTEETFDTKHEAVADAEPEPAPKPAAPAAEKPKQPEAKPKP